MNATNVKRMVPLIAAGLILFSTTSARAAAGDLDPGFGGDGKVTTNFTSGSDQAFGVAIQDDGKVVAVGSANGFASNSMFALARYEVDGTLDTTFGGGDGKVVTNFTSAFDQAVVVLFQSDGKIVAAGYAAGRFAVARYNDDGSLDTGFGGGDGKVMTNFTSGDDFGWTAALQTDGKIVVAGGAGGAGERFALARYETDGTLDTTFGGGDGKVVTNFTSGYDYVDDIEIQDDGMIVAAGAADYFRSRGKVALARYDTVGTLDPLFSGDGKLMTNLTSGFDGAFAVALQDDGKIVTAGQGGSFLAVARYESTGGLDLTFGGGDGKALVNFTSGVDYADEVAVQDDGKIVAAGAANYFGPNAKFAVLRLNSDGTSDSGFSGDGKVTTDFTTGRDGAWSMAIQEDGSIVASGYAGWQRAKFALVRYLVA
jgi:uncharacterized delta-60 repeat protein